MSSERTNGLEKLKLGFNNWFDRAFIRPAISDYDTKLYIKRYMPKLWIKRIAIFLVIVVLLSLTVSIIRHVIPDEKSTQTTKQSAATFTTNSNSKKETKTIINTESTTETVKTDKDGATTKESINKKESSTKIEPVKENKDSSPKSFTELTVELFEKNKVFKMVFNHLLVLFVIFIIYHMLLVMLGELNRLKLGGLEVESQPADSILLQSINQVTTKLDILVNWQRPDNISDLNSRLGNKTTMKEYMSEILSLMQKAYYDEWGILFTYNVFPKQQIKKYKYPIHVRRMVNALDSDQISVTLNKENPSRDSEESYLIYKMIVEEIGATGDLIEAELFVVLSSYKNQFDENDTQLVEGVCSLMQLIYKFNYVSTKLFVATGGNTQVQSDITQQNV
jgi:hypothetical protein